MNELQKSNLIEKINARFKRLENTSLDDYKTELKMFYSFLTSNEYLNSLLETLKKNADEYAKVNEGSIVFSPANDLERYCMSYALVRKCSLAGANFPQRDIMNSINGKKFAGGDEQKTSYFNSRIVSSLVEFLVDGLNNQQIILHLLKKYKQKCEWFKGEELSSKIINNSRTAEKILAFDLYEFLFENGIQFFIEPSSVSGKPDLITSQKSESPLIADAKIFNPKNKKDKHYLVKGVNQIYRYTQTFNESSAYLVIYKTCEQDLKLSLSNVANQIPL